MISIMNLAGHLPVWDDVVNWIPSRLTGFIMLWAIDRKKQK